MCDEDTNKDSEDYIRKISRREFGAVTAATSLAMILPPTANARMIASSEVLIKTPDGVCDALFVHPVEEKSPAVLMWPDILSLRPAFRRMATRLAESGYAVLCVNPYFRNSAAPVVAVGESFQDESTRAKVMPMYRNLSAKTHTRDAEAFVSWLDEQDTVDSKRKMGTMGYCMGGPIVMRTAAAVPSRIGAACSYHGGGLVTNGEDSPHLLIPNMKADFLIAIAENDDKREPETKTVLQDTFNKYSLEAEIEVYEGAMHGWCVLDSRVYNQEAAEEAWSRTLNLFNRSL